MRLFRLALLLLVCCVLIPAQSKSREKPDDFFSKPEVLCGALEDNGIHTGPWQPIGLGFAVTQSWNNSPSPYVCEYPAWVRGELRERDSATTDVSLVYRVSGDPHGRADTITLAVTVHKASAMRDGERELERNLELLFTRIGRSKPAGLIQSLERHRYFRSRQAYGNVSFSLVTPTRRPSEQVLWFRLWE